MREKPNNLAILIIGIVISIIITFGVFTFFKHMSSVNRRITDEYNRSVSKYTEFKLAAWIFNHSEQISMDTAKEIAGHCMKTRYPLLMIGLISVESNFKQTAVSKAGAVGLTQIMFKQHKDMLIKAEIIKDRRDLFNISNSIRAGDAIFVTYLEASHGNIEKAFERYLGGRDGAYLKHILLNVASLYVELQ